MLCLKEKNHSSHIFSANHPLYPTARRMMTEPFPQPAWLYLSLSTLTFGMLPRYPQPPQGCAELLLMGSRVFPPSFWQLLFPPCLKMTEPIRSHSFFEVARHWGMCIDRTEVELLGFGFGLGCLVLGAETDSHKSDPCLSLRRQHPAPPTKPQLSKSCPPPPRSLSLPPPLGLKAAAWLLPTAGSLPAPSHSAPLFTAS